MFRKQQSLADRKKNEHDRMLENKRKKGKQKLKD